MSEHYTVPLQYLHVDHNAFNYTACIDYITFLVTIVTIRSGTQFRYVQDHLEEHLHKTPFITMVEPTAGKVFNQFELTLYDAHANSHDAIDAVFKHLGERFPLASPPVILTLEAGIDAFPKFYTLDKIHAMTYWMQTHIHAHGDNPRQWNPELRDPKKHKDGAFTYFGLDHANRSDFNPEHELYIGQMDGDKQVKVYSHITDRGVPIPKAEHCARSEAKLQGTALAALGIHTLDDLGKLDFNKLAKHIRFANIISLNDATAGKNLFYAAGLKALWDDRAVCLVGGMSQFYRYKTTGKPRFKGQLQPRDWSKFATAAKAMNRIVDREFAKLGAEFHKEKNRENEHSEQITG